jgi:hypothetical protein
MAFGPVYVAYTTDLSGQATAQGDDATLDRAQAVADRAAGCPHPCSCPPWMEIARKSATTST